MNCSYIWINSCGVICSEYLAEIFSKKKQRCEKTTQEFYFFFVPRHTWTTVWRLPRILERNMSFKISNVSSTDNVPKYVDKNSASGAAAPTHHTGVNTRDNGNDVGYLVHRLWSTRVWCHRHQCSAPTHVESNQLSHTTITWWWRRLNIMINRLKFDIEFTSAMRLRS